MRTPGPQHTDLQRFDARSFAKPEPFYWPGYTWIWNDELTDATITRQMEDMASQGALTISPVPEPADFRPTWMPTRLSPEYLSADYMARVRHMGDEAKRLGMRIWLYDEGGWPSGSVCGRIVREHPELARQTLKIEATDLQHGQSVSAPDDCIAAFLAEPGETPDRLEPNTRYRAVHDGARLLVVTAERGGRYPDLLNPASTREFIRLTHDAYYRALGGEFGDTVPLVFTDEPSAANPPWTDGLAEDFLAKKGYDIRDRLPSIFGGDTPEDEKVRVDFFDWWSQRFADAYLGQIQTWCHDHGILSGGHLNGEDETLGSVHHGFGQMLRALRRFDVPGIDVIWRQLWPGKDNHHFPKYASTVARQDGKRWALTESMAVYGSGLIPAQMKWVLDYQLVRGINLVTMIGYPLSTADWMIGGERPHFGCETPMWSEMHRFNGYVARTCYLLSLGKAVVRTAVYLPIRDTWAGGPERARVVDEHDRLVRELLERQCDFDFVDDDALERDTTTAKDGALNVGAMAYDTVLVSRSAWMTEKARAKLAAFAAAGGRVICVDPPTGAAMPAGGRTASVEQAAMAVAPLARVEPANPNVRVAARDLSGGRLYFVTNEGTGPIDVAVTFPDNDPVVVLDPETATIGTPGGVEHVAGGTRLRLGMAFAGSRVLLFSRAALPAHAEPPVATRALLTIDRGWEARPVKSYVLGLHGIEVSAVTDAKPAAISLGDWRGVIGGGFTGDVEYRVQFQCDAAAAKAARLLDLGDARYATHVTLNGRDLGARIWPPFAVPVTGLVRDGANDLRVVVTNTLANQYAASPALAKWTAAQLGPYHPRALEFEKDSLPSGLYGPVRLLGE